MTAIDIYTDTNSQGLTGKKRNSKTQLNTGTYMLFLTKERWFELQGMINHGEAIRRSMGNQWKIRVTFVKAF